MANDYGTSQHEIKKEPMSDKEKETTAAKPASYKRDERGVPYVEVKMLSGATRRDYK